MKTTTTGCNGVRAIILNAKGEALTITRTKSFPWYPEPLHLIQFPGGTIEEGETPEQAMKREFEEEIIGLPPIDFENSLLCSSENLIDSCNLNRFQKAYICAARGMDISAEFVNKTHYWWFLVRLPVCDLTGVEYREKDKFTSTDWVKFTANDIWQLGLSKGANIPYETDSALPLLETLLNG